MHKKLIPAAVIATTTLLPIVAHAASGTDNAGNYNSTTGYAGQNKGTGFGTFVVNANGGTGGFAGTFIGSSGGAGFNIDTAGNSFGMYANSNPAAVVTVSRPFTTGLQNVGDQFGVQLRTDFNNSTTGQTFQFSIGPASLTLTSTGYALAGGTVVSTLTQSDFILNTTFSVTAGNKFVFTVTGNQGTDAATVTGNLAGPVSQFQTGGTNLPNNQYFNSLAVTNVVAPEPSGVSSLLIGSIVLGGVALIRRRRQTA